MPLTLLKLIPSQIYLKNSAKTTILRFREWLINVPLRSVLLITPVMKKKKTNWKILFPSKKYSVNLCIQSKCRKTRARNNSIFGHFHTGTVSNFHVNWCLTGRVQFLFFRIFYFCIFFRSFIQLGASF